MNKSWVAMNSRASISLRVLLRLGSDIIGFSPMMYRLRTPPGPTEERISVVVRPRTRLKPPGSIFQAFSNFWAAISSSTSW